MVAAGSSFGMTDATAARDLDTAAIAGLTAYPVRVLRASWNTAAGSAKQPVDDPQEIATRGGTPAPQSEAAISSGYPVKHFSGTLTLDVIARGFGNVSPANTGVGILLRSGLQSLLRTPGADDAATFATSNTFTVADATLYVAGAIIDVVQTVGRSRYCRVTNSNAGTFTVTTLEAHGHAGGNFTVRFCHLFYPPPSGTAAGNAAVIQLAPRDAAFTHLFVGCRLSKLEIVAQGKHSRVLRMTMTYADGAYNAAAIMTVAAQMLPYGVSGTTPLRTLVAPILVTQDHSSSSAPGSGTVSNLPVREWSAAIDIALEPTPDQGTRSGISEYSVASTVCTASVTLNAPTSGVDYREVLRLSEIRCVGLSSAGDNDSGNGMCLWLGAAHPTEDPGVQFEDSRRSQVVALRCGDYALDTAGADYANTPFTLAFTC
jgi:hypothetical protein